MKLRPIKKEHLLLAASDIDDSVGHYWAEYLLYIPEKGRHYPFKELVRRAYTLATGIEIPTNFFESNKGYRSYIERTSGFPVTFVVRDNQGFFLSADFDYFNRLAGKRYDPEKIDHQKAKKHLISMFFSKVDTWARALDLEGLSVDFRNNWQNMGHFARYAWARLSRPENADVPVYFTVEANGDETCLKYKLDYRYTGDHRLTPEQERIFKRIVDGTDAEVQTIDASELADYTWEDLLFESRQHFERYIPLYDEVVAAIRTPIPVATDPTSGLMLQPVPPGLVDKPMLQQRKYATNIDYDQENKHKKRIGTAGEDLVIALERAALEREGRGDLAKLVERMPDSHGYDIHSYFPDERPKYIEVKTTTGTVTRPFFWTWNEREQMLKYPGTYFLYRLYNFDIAAKRADYFILDGNIAEKVHEIPTQYTVFMKQNA